MESVLDDFAVQRRVQKPQPSAPVLLPRSSTALLESVYNRYDGYDDAFQENLDSSVKLAFSLVDHAEEESQPLTWLYVFVNFSSGASLFEDKMTDSLSFLFWFFPLSIF